MLRYVSAICAMTAAAGASGAIIDLTRPNSFGMVNGARFETADFQSAGTGVITSFVRLQANGREEGYNTSGRPVPFDEKTDPNFTTDLRIGQLPTVRLDEVDYYAFSLDINESLGGDSRLLSLDRVQIYTSSEGGKTTTDLPSLGALRFDLDLGGDNWVKLDAALNSGSGQGDMNMLVPVGAFAGASPDDFVYLYSMFGENIESGAGFEEWSFIPSSGPLALASLAGLMVAIGRRRV